MSIVKFIWFILHTCLNLMFRNFIPNTDSNNYYPWLLQQATTSTYKILTDRKTQFKKGSAVPFIIYKVVCECKTKDTFNK